MTAVNEKTENHYPTRDDVEMAIREAHLMRAKAMREGFGRLRAMLQRNLAYTPTPDQARYS